MKLREHVVPWLVWAFIWSVVLCYPGGASGHCPESCCPCPTPTVAAPGPTPSPAPTATAHARCPSDAIVLDGTLSNGWGILRQPIGKGTVKRYCARLLPPKIGLGVVPNRITFSWYTHPDQDCGRISMEVQQLSGARLLVRSAFPLPNGGLHFTRRVGRDEDPARVAQGDYLITVAGHSETCTATDVGWNWQ